MKKSVQVMSAAFLVSVIFSGSASATNYVPEDRLTRGFVYPPVKLTEHDPRIGAGMDMLDYMAELSEISEYLAEYQVADMEHEHFGGMREGESEETYEIVQTDNTQEAIWVWCRWGELNGDTETYAGNVEDAWTYVENYPAYDEEGVWYRVWNCGWALRCGMKYEEVYEESSFMPYMNDCAEHIIDHPLDYSEGAPLAGINAYATAWAVGNLYEYGVYRDDETYMNAATDMAEGIKLWIENDPEERLNGYTWALSGGVAFWAVMKAFFHESPSMGSEWLNEYAPLMTDYIPAEYATDPDANQWQNAWNCWYALADDIIWKVTGDFEYRKRSLQLARIQRLQDGDQDGGIPAREIDADDEDQMWITTYITYMGFGELEDAPRLMLEMNKQSFSEGDSLETDLLLDNPGLDEEVMLYCVLQFGDAYYFFPTWSTTPSCIHLNLPIETEFGMKIISVPFIPGGMSGLSFTWWGAFIDPYSGAVIGDICTMDWFIN